MYCLGLENLGHMEELIFIGTSLIKCGDYNISPLYNFINDTLVSESAVLKRKLRHLILYGFRLFLRKWHKIPVDEFVR